MKKANTFQIILMVTFGVIAIGAVGCFAFCPTPKSQIKATGTVTIWGTISDDQMALLTKFFNEAHEESVRINYVFKDPKTFDTAIVEALASGKGPDMILLPNDLIIRHGDKVKYMTLTEQFGSRQFKDAFLTAGEIYLRDDGIFAIPFMVDPLVLYWNRGLLANAGIVAPPKYWDELLSMTPKLTKKDAKQNITQSAIALGEYANIANAKDLIVMLFLQVGNPVIEFGARGVPVNALLDPTRGNAVESALRYYLDFANPQKSIYTWNRSRLNAEDEFVNGNLAFYIDYASKWKNLVDRNPHLDIDVAQVPQPRDATVEVDLARMHGLVIMKTTKNTLAANAVMGELAKSEYVEIFAKSIGLPPVRRDLLSKNPVDATQAVFYGAAIKSRTWPDPSPSLTEKAFREIVDGVSSGKYGVEGALGQLGGKLNNILGR